MKRITAVFTRQTFVTPDGTKTVYTHDRSLCPVLGQAQDLIVHLHGHRKSANAEIELQAWQSSVVGQRPDPLVLKTRRRISTWSVLPTRLVATPVPAWLDDPREAVPE